MLTLLSTDVAQVDAQSGDWEEPINISHSAKDSRIPSVVADPSGKVHVVWCEPLEGPQCEAIYYVSGDGGAWSTPIDIVYSAGGSASSPVLAADQSGMLHMVWVGGSTDRVLYSRAYAPDAGSARSWKAPVAIGDLASWTTLPDLATDGAGNLHIAFTVRSGDQGGVHYSQSSDGGRTWHRPVLVHAKPPGAEAVDQARLAVDEAGGIHLVWTEDGIRYARSIDGGNTWSEQLAIDGPYGFGGITTVGEAEVHLVWSGTTTDRKKLHRWSADQGVTWSPNIITHEEGGYQGWPGLVADSDGSVHLLQVSSFLVGGLGDLYYQVWQSEQWSPALLLRERVDGSPNHATDPDVSIGLGNELHVVVADVVQSPAGSSNWVYDIYYIRGLISAAALEPQPLAIPTLAAEPTVASRPAATVAPTRAEPTAATAGISLDPSIVRDSDPRVTVLVGIVPALVVVGCVIAVRLLRRSRA